MRSEKGTMERDNVLFDRPSKKEYHLKINGLFSVTDVDMLKAAELMPLDKLEELIHILKEKQRERRGY